MFKKILTPIAVIFAVLFFTVPVHAQSMPPQPLQQVQEKATIIKEVSKELDENNKLQTISYSVKLDNGKVVTARHHIATLQTLNIQPSSRVVILESKTPEGMEYQVVDLYRLPSLLYFLIVFIVAAVIIVGKKGVGSLLGLGISLLIILFGIIPAIMQGIPPLLVTIIGAFVILVITTFLAHGISYKTAVAVAATGASLLLTLLIATLCLDWLSLSGTGNENIADLYYATNKIINGKGLLLSGIIIGTLGALNDVTVTQASTLFEMKKIDPILSFSTLFKRGMTIGRDHGASMVNTIVLAYAGSSLFLFIFFIVNPQKQPVWVMLNSEFMVEEIFVALAGTLGILLSVPIVTALASYIASKPRPHSNK